MKKAKNEAEELRNDLDKLKSEVDSLKQLLGVFATALDKVSQIQSNENETLHNLLGTSETTVEYFRMVMKRLDEFEKRTLKEGGVFISYSHADKTLVHLLSQRFEKDSINYWLDDKDLLVGQVVDKEISKGIQKSWLFVIVLSPTSIKSKWVEREFEEASLEEIKGRKVVLPVVVNGLKVRSLPPRIRGKLFVDLTNDFESGYQKLRKSILTYLMNFSRKSKHSSKR